MAETTALQVVGVDHVAVAARDPQALADWYCRVLGMRILFRNEAERPTFLVGGSMGGVLEIMPDNGERAVAHAPFDPGFRHVALRVNDFDAAYEALEALHAAGEVLGVMPPAPAAGGGRIAYFHDPEGNLMQIVGREGDLFVA